MQQSRIAIIAATATLGTTAAQADFIDDSNVQLKFKNFYLERNYDNESQKTMVTGRKR